MTSPSSPQTTPHVSQAELRGRAQIGAVLFRNRSWLPVPFVLVALLVPAEAGALNWIAGLALVGLGEWIRLAGISAAGTVTRRRSRDVQRFVDYGAFAWTRNPLYVGNFFAWIGFALLSGVLWLVPVAAALFAIEYTFIVAYEEGVLESIFGEQYLDYKRRTPRWIPRPPEQRKPGEHHWGEAWRSEMSTFMQYAALVVAFALKQRVWWR